jgi:hypothetical protein
MVFLKFVLIDLALVTCSRRLHRQSSLGACCLLDRMVFGHVHRCFSVCSVLGGSVVNLLYLWSSLEMSFEFHGEARGGECNGY